MASTTRRRPLPALVALVALLALTGLVWWRVLNRGTTTTHVSIPCPTPKAKVHLPGPDSVTVDVFNATKRAGIASKARSTLVADGFNSPNLAQNDRKYLNKIKSTAQIRYGSAGRSGAILLHYYFPGAELVSTTTIKSQTVIVSLGTGYRAVASTTVVQEQLTRDKTVSGTATPTVAATCPT
jgi:hypothetical protein